MEASHSFSLGIVAVAGMLEDRNNDFVFFQLVFRDYYINWVNYSFKFGIC